MKTKIINIKITKRRTQNKKISNKIKQIPIKELFILNIILC